ncbi:MULTISPECIES: hypothetical protein [Streptomyces]|uniref:Uncharacterized protein n=1 Tax=Streptomyces abikoensis TaxID=97398 RepID=A0ABW7SZR9_9ACTN
MRQAALEPRPFAVTLSRTDTTPADRAALLTAFVNVLALLTR